MKYRLVLFDFDGTLADTLPWMRSIFNELADEHGFRRVEPDEYARFRDLHGMHLLRELGLPLRRLPGVGRSMTQRMAAVAHNLSLFPGISRVLQGLAEAGMQLGVVTSNARENVERVLGPDNLPRIRHFSCGVSFFGKAGKLRQVVRASGIAPEHVLYIGDEVRDAEAARKAGLAFGAVTWGQQSPEALRACQPAEFFTSVEEILEKLC